MIRPEIAPQFGSLEPTARKPCVRSTGPEKAAAVDAAIAAAKGRPHAKRIAAILSKPRGKHACSGDEAPPEHDAGTRQREERLRDAQRSFLRASRDWLPYAGEDAREALLELLARVYLGGAGPREFSQAVASVRKTTRELW